MPTLSQSGDGLFNCYRQRFDNMYKELLLRLRENVESRLAIGLLNHRELFPVTEKISGILLQLIESHHDIIQKIIRENPDIGKDMTNPNLFGALRGKKDADNLFHDMTCVLQNSHADINQVMLVHFVFMRYILPKIIPQQPTVKFEIENVIFFKDRPRKENFAKHPAASNDMGIVRNPVLQKLLNEKSCTRIRPIDKYIQREESAYFNADMMKNMSVQDIPFVSGPSGHTAVLLSGAKNFFGISDMEELKQYATLCFAHLTAGGCHNFHEVFYVAWKIANVPYEMNCYESVLPQLVLQNDFYKSLSAEFSQFFAEGRVINNGITW